MPFVLETSDTIAGHPIKLHSVTLQAAYSPGKLPAIVFIHGGLGSRYNWRIQWEQFRDLGQAVLAYDLAGHGESGRYRRYSVGRHRRNLTQLLNYFKIKNPVLACHSYGVPIGLEWAKRHPTHAIVAIGGGTHNLTPWWEIPVIKFFAIGGHNLYRVPQLNDTITALLNPKDTNPKDTEKPVPNDMSLPADRHPYEAIEAFWGYDGRFPNIQCPITIITGGNDPMFTPAMGHEWLSHLQTQHPKSTHITVPDVGHVVMTAAPNVVNQAILHAIE